MRISDWSSDVCSSDLIKADDFGGIGYGYGYAFAEDNLCVLLEDLVTIRGERAKYMGRDGSYTIVPNSNTADNVTSDYFWKFVATDAIVANLDRKSVVSGKSVSVRVDLGGRRIIKKKTKKQKKK